MVKVSSKYISIGCNKTAHAACWGNNDLIAFGANSLIALYAPMNEHSKGVQETLRGHKDRVICLKFIERGAKTGIKDAALVSGSADNKVKIWKTNAEGKWVNSATLDDHTGAVETIACMRAHSIEVESDIFVTGASDGTIRVWERKVIDDDTDEVTCKQVINCGNKYPLALALSYLPGSKVPILASGHTDKAISIYIYQLATGQFEKLHVLQGHDNWVRDLSFATYTESDDTNNNNLFQEGDLVLASASQDKYIRLWKVSAHTPSTKAAPSDTTVDSELLEALKQSDLDNEQLSTKAHLVTVDSRQYSFMFEALLIGHDDWVFSVEWQRPHMQTLADGSSRFVQPMRLISASSDKSMMVWSPDSETGIWVNEVRMGDIGGGASLGFCGAMFSPDGKSIVSHSANGSFHLWKNNAESKNDNRWAPQVAISGHFKPVKDLAWEPQSRFLLSVSLDQTTRLYAPWNRDIDGGKVTTWHEVGRPQVHGYDIKCISFIRDWQFVSGADEKVLRVFDAPKSSVENLAQITQVKGMLTDIESRPVSASLPALGLSNKAIFEGDAQAEKDNQDDDMKAPTAAENVNEALKHPPFEEQLLQHSLWPEVEKLYGHLYELVCVDTTNDGKYIASACKATTPEHAVVRLFNTENWREVKTKIDAHTLTVTRVKFSHNDRWLLTVSRDRVWSISERDNNDIDTPYKIVTKEKAHARIIWDCSWSHDDKLFVTGSRDKTLKIWAQPDESVPKWTCVATIKCPEAITSVDFAPVTINEKYTIAVGLENGQIQLFSSIDLQTLGQWEMWYDLEERLCHYGVVQSLLWRKPVEGENNILQLASGGEDHSVRIFNVEY